MGGMRWIVLGVALTFASFVTAQERLTQMVNRGDMLGWEAVGRLDLPSGFCTGVLLSRDQVLTAAHCLFDQDTRQRVDLSKVRFLGGYLRGDALYTRRLKGVRIAEGYNYSGPVMQASLAARDVAVLTLDRPVYAAEALPFKVHDGQGFVGDVQVMSYGRDRAEAMSWQSSCQALRQSSTLFEFDCDTTLGSSGAPVFARQNGRVRILSLVSGRWDTEQGAPRVVGMKLSTVLAELLSEADVSEATGAKRLAIGGNRPSTGAKFLRP